MPLIFHDDGGALALSIDHVNSLVDDNTVITGLAHGPVVDYLGSGAHDIMEDYMRASFLKGGYASVISAESEAYHDFDGNIHCGTNVRRQGFAYRWWEQ